MISATPRALDDLGLPSYWEQLSGNDRLAVTMVLPTGRALDSGNGHIALSTDALYLTEIGLALKDLAERAEVDASIRCILDIDFLEDLSVGGGSDDNVIVSGSAGVNAAASLLLDNTASYDDLGCGFTRPYDAPVIKGRDGTRYTHITGVNTGALSLYTSPWSRSDRIAVLCAGILAVGTSAALLLLLRYLQGRGDGNNRIDPSRPLKIVNGIPRRYKGVDVRDVTQCIPPMEIASLTGITIHE